VGLPTQVQARSHARVEAVTPADAALAWIHAGRGNLHLGAQVDALARAERPQLRRPERHRDPRPGAGAPRYGQPLDQLRAVTGADRADLVARVARRLRWGLATLPEEPADDRQRRDQAQGNPRGPARQPSPNPSGVSPPHRGGQVCHTASAAAPVRSPPRSRYSGPWA